MFYVCACKNALFLSSLWACNASWQEKYCSHYSKQNVTQMSITQRALLLSRVARHSQSNVYFQLNVSSVSYSRRGTRLEMLTETVHLLNINSRSAKQTQSYFEIYHGIEYLPYSCIMKYIVLQMLHTKLCICANCNVTPTYKKLQW